MTGSPSADDSIPVVPVDDPRALAATAAVQAGDLTELERLLTAQTSFKLTKPDARSSSEVRHAAQVATDVRKCGKSAPDPTTP